MSRYREIDLSNLRRTAVQRQERKVDRASFASNAQVSLADFWSAVPDVLKARDMKELIDLCVKAVGEGKPLIIGLGGHVIKCGLAPLLIGLMHKGAIKALAMNGSVIIHDYEIACFGCTSEDVDKALENGSFGMAGDTAHGLNSIIVNARQERLGLGEAVGQALSEKAPNKDLSLLANAWDCSVPCTVHVALGTDIIHQHPCADGAAIGETSLRDFRIFCQEVIALNEGGVFLNLGSSVIIPEVFLKAVSTVRNLGHPLRDFTTAVFDMNLHYRPRVNVTERPVSLGGKGFYFIGHHEIMLPLFFLSLQERLSG